MLLYGFTQLWLKGNHYNGLRFVTTSGLCYPLWQICLWELRRGLFFQARKPTQAVDIWGRWWHWGADAEWKAGSSSPATNSCGSPDGWMDICWLFVVLTLPGPCWGPCPASQGAQQAAAVPRRAHSSLCAVLSHTELTQAGPPAASVTLSSPSMGTSGLLWFFSVDGRHGIWHTRQDAASSSRNCVSVWRDEVSDWVVKHLIQQVIDLTHWVIYLFPK